MSSAYGRSLWQKETKILQVSLRILLACILSGRFRALGRVAQLNKRVEAVKVRASNFTCVVLYGCLNIRNFIITNRCDSVLESNESLFFNPNISLMLNLCCFFLQSTHRKVQCNDRMLLKVRIQGRERRFRSFVKTAVHHSKLFEKHSIP